MINNPFGAILSISAVILGFTLLVFSPYIISWIAEMVSDYYTPGSLRDDHLPTKAESLKGAAITSLELDMDMFETAERMQDLVLESRLQAQSDVFGGGSSNRRVYDPESSRKGCTPEPYPHVYHPSSKKMWDVEATDIPPQT